MFSTEPLHLNWHRPVWRSHRQIESDGNQHGYCQRQSAWSPPKIIIPFGGAIPSTASHAFINLSMAARVWAVPVQVEGFGRKHLPLAVRAALAGNFLSPWSPVCARAARQAQPVWCDIRGIATPDS